MSPQLCFNFQEVARALRKGSQGRAGRADLCRVVAIQCFLLILALAHCRRDKLAHCRKGTQGRAGHDWAHCRVVATQRFPVAIVQASLIRLPVLSLPVLSFPATLALLLIVVTLPVTILPPESQVRFISFEPPMGFGCGSPSPLFPVTAPLGARRVLGVRSSLRRHMMKSKGSGSWAPPSVAACVV